MTSGILVVIDGWGVTEDKHGNAIAAARTPTLDHVRSTQSTFELHASGQWVGLPKGVVGNSEIGHMVMGAGRPLEYDSLLVQQAVDSGRLRSHPRLRALFEKLAAGGRTLHLVGLCSDGMIHADTEHLVELARAAAAHGVSGVVVHAITDGRDVTDHTAGTHLDKLGQALGAIGAGRIQSVMGRNYAMDKSGRVDLTRKAARLILDGHGLAQYSVAACVSGESAERGDGWIPPSVIPEAETVTVVESDDAILFTNFRSDRITPLVDMIAEELDERRQSVRLLSLAQYDTRAHVECLVPRADASGGIADVMTENELASTRIAEREKFEHVTFYINGRDPQHRDGEKHVQVKGATDPVYVENPRMNIDELVEAVTHEATVPDTALVIVNLANIDVVGHTGAYEATMRAAEAVDSAVARILDSAQRAGRWVLLVGDHGNGECMVRTDDMGDNHPFGGHTLNKVPCVLVPAPGEVRTLAGTEESALPQVAPTVCELLGVRPSAQMTSPSLLLPESH